MLTAFVLSMSIAAPVPVPPPAPVATSPLPRLMEVKANADGKIMVNVTRTTTKKVIIGQGNAINPNGGAPPAVITKEVQVSEVVSVELGEVKDLKITTADGKKVEVADAVKKLKDGGVVVVSADGKPISPNYLKLFKDDVLILASPELTGAAGSVGPKPFPGGPRPPAVDLPLPAPGNVIPANPANPIQIQIQPGQIQILPAPVPAPVPAPEK